MAKLTAPLLSMDARGALGKAMVFIGWKGIKSVRQYVVPANPQSTAQTTQRGLMANCVNFWQAITTAAKTAWDAWAPFEATPMSGFNSCTKAGVAQQKDDVDNVMLDEFTITPGDGELVIAATAKKVLDQSAVASLANLRVVYGTSARVLGSTATLTWNAGTSKYDATISGLTNGTLYYLRGKDNDSGLAISGLFSDTPAA